MITIVIIMIIIVIVIIIINNTSSKSVMYNDAISQVVSTPNSSREMLNTASFVWCQHDFFCGGA